MLGVTTNIAFLRTLLADPDVQAGRLDTTLAERVADRLRAALDRTEPPGALRCQRGAIAVSHRRACLGTRQ